MTFFIGTGTTITFASGFLAEIIDVSPPNASRESVQVSHMETTIAHRFLPTKLVDWGELGVEMAFDASTKPPVNDNPESVTITFPDSNSSTWTFQGFLTGFEPGDPLEDRATATATLKVDGDVTVV